MQVKLKKIFFVALGVMGISQFCSAELLWNPKPTEKQASGQHDQHAGHGHSGSREKSVYLEDQQNAVVKYIDPGLKELSLSAEDNSNKYVLPKTGMDNYHAIIAQRSTDKSHESSLRYIYMRGKPSGYSPENLIKQHKLPLEIIPDPMIREHWRYYSNNQHAFKIFFNNKPLTDSWVIFQSSNGTKLDAKTDSNGKVSFILPDDFQDVKAGRRANPPAEFLLRTVHIDNKVTYKTNFSAPYSVNPSHWQSNMGGIIALSFGFISGIIIMRKHHHKTSKEQAGKKTSGRAS